MLCVRGTRETALPNSSNLAKGEGILEDEQGRAGPERGPLLAKPSRSLFNVQHTANLPSLVPLVPPVPLRSPPQLSAIRFDSRL